MPSLFYREYHHYIAKDDKEDFTVEYEPVSNLLTSRTGRDMKFTKDMTYISMFAMSREIP